MLVDRFRQDRTQKCNTQNWVYFVIVADRYRRISDLKVRIITLMTCSILYAVPIRLRDRRSKPAILHQISDVAATLMKTNRFFPS